VSGAVRRYARLAELQPLVGQVLGTSDWIVVDQARIHGFADTTDDRQWIHVDPARAATGPFGGTIAHGFLTLSLLPRMLAGAFEVADVQRGVNYGLDRMRFPSPVPSGSSLRGHFALAAYTPVEGGAQLALEATVEIADHAKPACFVLRLLRFYH
jgi:acyl dehydratase